LLLLLLLLAAVVAAVAVWPLLRWWREADAEAGRSPLPNAPPFTAACTSPPWWPLP
jgi:hypothetical protein